MIIIDILDNERPEQRPENRSEKSADRKTIEERKGSQSIYSRFSNLAQSWKIALSQPKKEAAGNPTIDNEASSQ
jgi:hypothetical protein